jgi:hypothetical protein
MPGKFAKKSPPSSFAHIATCAHCLSRLLQLEAWREHGDGRMTLRLRCPDCNTRVEQDFEAAEVARLDDALAQARLEMTALHAAVVRENMEREAAVLERALALDLIGPEDFARPVRA